MTTESSGGPAEWFPVEYRAPAIARDMLVRTWSFLDALAPSLRDRCLYPLTSSERVDWDFIPKPDRAGLSVRNLDSHQRTLLHILLRAGLSESGYTKLLGIVAMENILRDREVEVFGLSVGDFRHADNYYISFFGRPGFDETWSWRFLGHHVSITFTIIEQQVVIPTPLNFGSQPASAGRLAPLEREEALGLALVQSLSDDQRARALLNPRAPADYVTRQVPLVGAVELPDYVDLGMPDYRITDEDRQALRYELTRRSGLPASEMSEDSRRILDEIIGEFSGRIKEELAGPYAAYMRRNAPEEISFCWAGATEKGASHYYRVELAGHLIELCNSIDEGNHIHSTLRDVHHDFGAPVLMPSPQLGVSLPPGLMSRLTSTVARPERSSRAEPSQ